MSDTTSDAVAGLKQLCDVLATDQVSVDDVLRRLGAVAADPGDGSTAVQPANPAFDAARIVTGAESDAPSHVELKVREGSGLTVADLRAAFGDYRELPRVHWNNPVRLIFHVDYPEGSHTCAIIATVNSGRDVEAGEVTGLTARRDVKLAE